MKKIIGVILLVSYWLLFLLAAIAAQNFFYTATAVFLPMIIIPWEILRGFFVFPLYSIVSIVWIGLGLYLVSCDE